MATRDGRLAAREPSEGRQNSGWGPSGERGRSRCWLRCPTRSRSRSATPVPARRLTSAARVASGARSEQQEERDRLGEAHVVVTSDAPSHCSGRFFPGHLLSFTWRTLIRPSKPSLASASSPDHSSQGVLPSSCVPLLSHLIFLALLDPQTVMTTAMPVSPTTVGSRCPKAEDRAGAHRTESQHGSAPTSPCSGSHRGPRSSPLTPQCDLPQNEELGRYDRKRFGEQEAQSLENVSTL